MAFSVAAGGISAIQSARTGFMRGNVRVGAWDTNLNTGSAEADASLRAGIALGGLLALNRSETIYFNATTDDDGNQLLSNCSYRVVGKELPSRWWSITAYGADNFLIDNPQNRYSFSMATLPRDADGNYTIQVGGNPSAANYLPVGSPAESLAFALTLRLYNPTPEAAANVAALHLPAIHRERCR